MAVTIQIMQGEPGNPAPLTLDKTTVLIGRGSDQDVRLTNPTISRRHCVIEKREGQWAIIDEESRTGLLVNGQRVRNRRPIHHGDVVEAGEVLFRVGLDRALKDEGPRRTQANLPLLVRSISAMLVLFVLGLAMAAGSLLYNYQKEMTAITAQLPVNLPAETSIKVFVGSPDERNVTFKPLVPPDGWFILQPLTYDNPFPEWNLSDIWSAANVGMEPRLFNGLDLNLTGGEQIVTSGYFFHRRTYNVRDASDPYGLLYFEIEGWSGFGERYGPESFPAERQYEVPHYVQSVELYPQAIKPGQHPSFEGVEMADFNWVQQLYVPGPNDQPVAPPKTEAILTEPLYRTKVLSPPQTRRVLMDGRFYSFFKDGCRYTVVVRGSANLLRRFNGGLDALAEAFFQSVQIAPVTPLAQPPLPNVAGEIERMMTMLVAYDRKPDILDVVRYEDLVDVRNWLLKMQKYKEPINDEPELRRLYFKIRDKTQRGLTVSLGRAYDEQDTTRSEVGERELMKIRNFLGNYPPLTLKRGQPDYPEWAWFFEEATRRPPYTTLSSAKAQRKSSQ